MAYERSDDGFFKFVTGMFLGVIAGIAAGALMAEKPGNELRRDLEANSEELMHNLRERFDTLKDRANEQFKDFKGFTDDRFRESAMSIQDKVNDLGKQLEELTQNRNNFSDDAKKKQEKIHSNN